ncbi:hypothetical protein FRUB_05912 [Fimbriiglobus ruber]|uniref:Uncharacterized protein n=1 Tax=Fimbriiglobus ruber TaxID=1908690 RepID=A0A225DQ81_9BACT|nr:hypothetical protein FRUB_05912 [Fimbriiglobus ruber]
MRVGGEPFPDERTGLELQGNLETRSWLRNGASPFNPNDW